MGLGQWLASRFKRAARAAPDTGPARPAVEPEATAGEVFTPTSPAERTFVPRVREAKLLKQALNTRGTQTVLYGESGAGKSSLAVKVLRDLNRAHIITRCTAAMDYDAVVRSGFDKLGGYSITTLKQRDSTELHAGTSVKLGSELVAGSVTFEGGFAKVVEGESESRRIVEYQISAENLVTALARRDLSWVIEDFHKVTPETRAQLADALKVFSDHAHPHTAIVVLGATDSPADVVQAPADMGNRLAQIPVPALDDEQLGRILDDGGAMMNVDFAPVREAIVRTSAGVASVTHALALKSLQELEIEKPPRDLVTITPAILREAAWAYASSMQGSMKQDFAKAMYLKRSRKYDNCAIILKALASLPEHGGTHAGILAEIHKTLPDYPTGNLTTYLVQLSTEERGGVVRKTADGRHRFDYPLLHTFAQITFKLDPREGDLFAAELATQVTENEQRRAIAAAADNSEPGE